MYELTPYDQIVFEANVGRLEVLNTSNRLLAYKVRVNASGYMLKGECAILKPSRKKSIKLVTPWSGSIKDYAEINFFHGQTSSGEITADFRRIESFEWREPCRRSYSNI